MLAKIGITKEALEILTLEQRDQIAYLAGPHMTGIFVYKDFSLPADYVAVKLHYNTGATVFGGIDAEGRLST